MRRSFKLPLSGLVLAGLLGGSFAYVAAEKSLTVTVDGESRSVDTYASTVADVLADAGLVPASQDVVLPGPDAEVEDGDAIVLNRARPLQLTVDGVATEVYTTASSVDEALDQLGYRSDDLVLSASRSERVPLDGMALAVSTPKDITLVADGTIRVVSTTAGTAAQLLAEQGVLMGPTDRMTLTPDRPLLDRMRLQVLRVAVTQVTETAPIDYATVETEDPEALEGTEEVTQEGVEGEQTTTYAVTITDGVETAREQVSVAVTTPPVDELVSVGTMPRPVAAPRSSASGGSGEVPATADGLNWAALADCESGGNPSAVSGTGKYRGMYQFSQTTWNSVGGEGDPADASAAEQTLRAQMLYERGGAGQWPHCGPRLFT